MPYSYGFFKNEIIDFMSKYINNNNITKILDVGPGCGTYGKLMESKNILLDAVEIFEPNIDKFKLKYIYKNVYLSDIRDFDISNYEFLIIGDVLEHLSVDDAQILMNKINNLNIKCMIAVPYIAPQGICEDNDAEIHIQDDLTKELMNERYPSLKLIFGNEQYGYYINFNEKDKKNMKILFLQIYTQHISPYFQYVTMINAAYCVKHGYEYKTTITNVLEGYGVSWGKLFAIKEEYDNYDYIFFLDSDAVIMNDEITIGNRIENMKGHILFSENGWNGGDLINAGALILKCSDSGKKFIDDTLEAALLDEYKESKNGKYQEQDVINALYEKEEYKNIIDVFPMNYINSHWKYDYSCNDRQYIFHFMSWPLEDKVNIIKKIFYRKFLSELNNGFKCKYNEPGKHIT